MKSSTARPRSSCPTSSLNSNFTANLSHNKTRSLTVPQSPAAPLTSEPLLTLCLFSVMPFLLSAFSTNILARHQGPVEHPLLQEGFPDEPASFSDNNGRQPASALQNTWLSCELEGMAGTSQRTAGSIFSSFGGRLLYLSFWNVYFSTNHVVFKSNFHALDCTVASSLQVCGDLRATNAPEPAGVGCNHCPVSSCGDSMSAKSV